MTKCRDDLSCTYIHIANVAVECKNLFTMHICMLFMNMHHVPSHPQFIRKLNATQQAFSKSNSRCNYRRVDRSDPSLHTQGLNQDAPPDTTCVLLGHLFDREHPPIGTPLHCMHQSICWSWGFKKLAHMQLQDFHRALHTPLAMYIKFWHCST